jgi:hypothetical protein
MRTYAQEATINTELATFDCFALSAGEPVAAPPQPAANLNVGAQSGAPRQRRS